jgi:hypothetical protein
MFKHKQIIIDIQLLTIIMFGFLFLNFLYVIFSSLMTSDFMYIIEENINERDKGGNTNFSFTIFSMV